MHRKKRRAHWVFLLFTCCCMFVLSIPKEGSATSAVFVSSEPGGNNGNLTGGAGTDNASANVYVLSSAQSLPATEYTVRVNLSGSGFTPSDDDVPVLALAASFSGNWEEDPSASMFAPTTDSSGDFAPATLTLRRKSGSGAFSGPETIQFTLTDNSVSGQVSLTLSPIPVALPAAGGTPLPVTIPMGANWSAGRSLSVAGPNGTRLALRGMAALRDDNSSIPLDGSG